MVEAIEHGRVYILQEPKVRSAWIGVIDKDGRSGLCEDRGRFLRKGINGTYFDVRDGVIFSPGGSIPTAWSDGVVRTVADLEDAGFDAIESGRAFRALQRELESTAPQDPHFGCDHQDAPCQVRGDQHRSCPSYWRHLCEQCR